MDEGENMENDKTGITQKLSNIVKLRKTPIIVNKQENNYKNFRRAGRSFASEGYSYDSEE